VTWLAWRQLRLQLLAVSVALVTLAVVAIVTGLHLRSIFNSVGGASCQQSFQCYRVTGAESTLRDGLGPLLLALPALIGMFWGAPLVARELETGTYRLAWTQSVTRREWLTVKLAVFGSAAVVVTGLVSWLISWWYGPIDAARLDRLHPSVFTERGVVAIGYAAFAFALGVVAGALIRRVLPAMVATLLGFTAVRLLVTWLRPHLLPASNTVLPGDSPISSFNVKNSWTLADKTTYPHQPLSKQQFVRAVLGGCRRTGTVKCRPILQKNGTVPLHGYVRLHHVTYQAANHYWPLQFIETAIFLALAAILLWAAIWNATPRSRDPVPPPTPMRLLTVSTGDSGTPRDRDDDTPEPTRAAPVTLRTLTALPHPSD
jgi:hypothetical protein